MFIIGITGGSGAGKTFVLQAFEASGVLTIDCDAVYHELLESSAELKSDIGATFEGTLRDGVIDRESLGSIVFADPVALNSLNAITHRHIGPEIDRRLAEWEAQGGKVAAIDAIALIESGRAKICDIVIGITAPRNVRIKRIMARDTITRAQAEMRINAQKPDSFYEENCDYILEGTYTNPDELKEKCEEFLI